MEASRAIKRRVYRSNLSTMKRAIAKLGARAIPGNTKLGYALKAWRKELVDDLGGEENISIQQRTIIECASTTKLMISSVDAWIMSQPSLITRDRALMPVIIQRQQLVNGLVSMLSQLGLKRVNKEISLRDYLTEKYGEKDSHKSTSNVHVNKPASAAPASLPVEEKDSDA